MSADSGQTCIGQLLEKGQQIVADVLRIGIVLVAQTLEGGLHIAQFLQQIPDACANGVKPEILFAGHVEQHGFIPDLLNQSLPGQDDPLRRQAFDGSIHHVGTTPLTTGFRILAWIGMSKFGMRHSMAGLNRRTDFAGLLVKAEPHWAGLAFVLVFMLLQSATSLAMPLVAARFSVGLLAGDPVSGWLFGLFGLVVAQSVLGYIASVRAQRITLDMVATLGSKAFDHVQSLPMLWHQAHQRGALVSLLIQDVSRVGQYVTGTLLPVLPLLLTATGAMVMIMRISPWLGLVLAVLVPVLVVVMRLVGRQLRPMARNLMDLYGQKTAVAEQALAMLPVVKSFAAEPVESARYAAALTSLRDAEFRFARLQGAIAPFVRILAGMAVISLLWLASRELAKGVMAPEELVSLLFYGLLLTQPISGLANTYGATVSARGSAERLLEVFNTAPESDHGQQRLTKVRGELALQDVGFGYSQRSRLFDGLDIHVDAGETVAITGPNGAGKSTLVHLLLRLIEPDTGRILLDDVDIQGLSLKHLRSNIALVSQNVLLFNDSIAANIAYGRPDASLEDIRAAARAARADDFVMGLAQGYDTVVGDQGIRLSGGQKQRVSLARALLTDPAVLILDEATAMFDPEGEAEFIAECHDVLKHRTVILITHRPASLALADRILRLEQGRLIEAIAR